MIDIHNHLLPNVDDGAQSLEQSLNLLRNAEKEGITDIILTPHFIKQNRNTKTANELKLVFEQFKKSCKEENININLFLGNECFIHPQLDELLMQGEALTLAESNYVLIEFPFDHYSDEYDEVLYNVTIAGYKVIIAHPERYDYVQKEFRFVERWLDEGYLLQVNQNSLFEKQTSKTALKLIEQDYVSFIATDCHNENRPCCLHEAKELIRKKYGLLLTDELFFNAEILQPIKVG